MQIKTAPVTVLGAFPYGSDVQWKSGAPILGLKVLAGDDGQVLENLTVGEQLADVPAAGARVRLVLDWTRELVARTAQGGRGYVATKDKFRVLAVEPA